MPRDTAGKALADYPHPNVAVDTAVLTVAPERGLEVLLVRREPDHYYDGEWSLPGTFLHEKEVLADAVRRSLREKAGIAGREPRQLHVFDALKRDKRGWVLSVAHLDVLPWRDLQPVLWARPDTLDVQPVDRVVGLPWDHDDIVRRAASTVRADFREAPDPYRLLPSEIFTMRQLTDLHSAVAGDKVSDDVVRRLAAGHVEETGERAVVRVGKPAMLYRWR